MKKKIGRNDPCPCGSKKKFKKCCEKKMLGKKFLATHKTSAPGLTNLFQTRIESSKPLSSRHIVQGPISPKVEKPSEKKEEGKPQDPNSQKEP